MDMPSMNSQPHENSHSMSSPIEVKHLPDQGNFRADSRFAPSQWETSLQSNAVSHWLGANLESALQFPKISPAVLCSPRHNRSMTESSITSCTGAPLWQLTELGQRIQLVQWLLLQSSMDTHGCTWVGRGLRSLIIESYLVMKLPCPDQRLNK